MKKSLKVLYAGDSGIPGPANYLYGVLKSFCSKVVDVPPADKLNTKKLLASHDVMILSDYSRSNLTKDVELQIQQKVLQGMGLLMVGGWASFSGIYGNWRGSVIESLLPVQCREDDDRTNFPSGALLKINSKHPVLSGIASRDLLVICGLNRIRPKPGSDTILCARKIKSGTEKIMMDGRPYPLLVTGRAGRGRTAAFACDFAPHWCGGLLDWGRKREILPVRGKVKVEVSDSYVRLIQNIILWLAGRI